jgi:hypothetical protein
MKSKVLVGIVGFLTLFAYAGAGNVSAEAKSGVAIVMDARGSAKVTPAGQAEQVLVVGTEVGEGDSIATGANSYVKLIRTDSSVIKLNQNTKFSIEQTQQGEEKGSIFKVALGQLFMKVFKEKGVAKKFLIKTPTAVAAVRGTEIDVNVDEAGGAIFTVLEGIVDVTNPLGAVTLNLGQQTHVKSIAEPPAVPVAVNLNQPRWDEEAEKPQQPEKQPGEKDQGQKDQGVKPEGKEATPPPAGEEEEVVPEPPAPPVEEASPTLP